MSFLDEVGKFDLGLVQLCVSDPIDNYFGVIGRTSELEAYIPNPPFLCDEGALEKYSYVPLLKRCEAIPLLCIGKFKTPYFAQPTLFNCALVALYDYAYREKVITLEDSLSGKRDCATHFFTSLFGFSLAPFFWDDLKRLCGDNEIISKRIFDPDALARLFISDFEGAKEALEAPSQSKR